MSLGHDRARTACSGHHDFFPPDHRDSLAGFRTRSLGE